MTGTRLLWLVSLGRSRVRLLVVTYRFPAYTHTADRNVIYHLVRHFSKRHEVSLVALATERPADQSTDLIREFCARTEVVPLPRWRSVLNASLGVLRDGPLQLHYYWSPEMRARVQQVAVEQRIDVAYGYHLRSAPYLMPLNGIPKVVALQPAQVLHFGRRCKVIRNPLKRLLYGLEYRRLIGYEQAVAERFERCLLISETDREAIDPEGRLANVFYNPHGTDVARFAPPPDMDRDPASLVFAGAMNIDTNTDAVHFFVRDILPLIWRKRPDVRLYVVGRHPPRSVRLLARDSRIVVTGLVPDLRPHLWRATIGIDPIRIAAGMQNKVIEGMAAGLPLVITSVANEGIGAVDNDHVLIADGPQKFASAVLELLRDPARARALAQRAETLARSQWTWEFHFESLEALLKDVVDRRNAPLSQSVQPAFKAPS
jgi:sugar transferase (PEP-CTERM/EpsH1 system associated)